MSGGRPRMLRVIRLAVVAPVAILMLPVHSFADDKPSRSPAAPAKRAGSNDGRRVAKPAAVRSESAPCIHIVRRGESVGRIAAHYRVTRDAIIAANHLGSPPALRVGQRLEVTRCRTVPQQRVVAQRDLGPIAIEDENALLARVGPLRIPTRLHVGMPDLSTDAIEFQWPADGVVASGFGRRRAGWHAGVDIKAELGDPIRAAAAGTVIVSTWEPSYGWVIKLQHSGGFTSLYAHNLKNLVEAGDVVEAGALIATVGRSGRATAPHLHFEIRRDQMAYNPLHLLEMRQPSLLASVSEATLDDGEDRE